MKTFLLFKKVSSTVNTNKYKESYKVIKFLIKLSCHFQSFLYLLSTVYSSVFLRIRYSLQFKKIFKGDSQMGLKNNIKKAFISNVNRLSDIILTDYTLHTFRKVTVYLAVISFFAILGLIFIDNSKILDIKLPFIITNDYYFAVYVAFTFVLFYEVVSMIFTLPKSVSVSIGKQYQIMSLMILRTVFEHIGHYKVKIEKIDFFMIISNWDKMDEIHHILLELFAGILGPLLLFFLIWLYYKQQKHTQYLKVKEDFEGFIAIKKLMALFLLLILVVLGVIEMNQLFAAEVTKVNEVILSHDFFKNMFTVMIFVDIILILLTQRYTESYHVVFRNSGLAISTVLLRMSFVSSIFISVTVSIFAVLIGVIVTAVYNRFQEMTQKNEEDDYSAYR